MQPWLESEETRFKTFSGFNVILIPLKWRYSLTFKLWQGHLREISQLRLFFVPLLFLQFPFFIFFLDSEIIKTFFFMKFIGGRVGSLITVLNWNYVVAEREMKCQWNNIQFCSLSNIRLIFCEKWFLQNSFLLLFHFHSFQVNDVIRVHSFWFIDNDLL